jgi:hypothetical protein
MSVSKRRLRRSERKMNYSNKEKLENESIKLKHEAKYYGELSAKETKEAEYIKMQIEKEKFELEHQKRVLREARLKEQKLIEEQNRIQNNKAMNKLLLGEYLNDKYYINKSDLLKNEMLEIFEPIQKPMPNETALPIWFKNFVIYIAFIYLYFPGKILTDKKREFLEKNEIYLDSTMDVINFNSAIITLEEKIRYQTLLVELNKNEQEKLQMYESKYKDNLSSDITLFGPSEYKIGYSIPNETLHLYGDGTVTILDDELNTDRIIKVKTHEIYSNELIDKKGVFSRVDELKLDEETVIVLDGVFAVLEKNIKE